MTSHSRINHLNVVTAYNAFPVDELLVFAMEYIDGVDLDKLVKNRLEKGRGPLPVVNACYYVLQAAQGLQHAFEKNLVHRDIKPQNLIVARNGKKHIVKILDFGLAKIKREQGEDAGLTGTGEMLGTPAYIAPEQSRDASHANIRADIYSLGCTLYHLLTSAPPFTGRSAYEVLRHHELTEAQPVHLIRPDVPEALATVVKKMMAKDPAERYQTPIEVAKALAPFVKPKAKTEGIAEPGIREEQSRVKQETSSIDTGIPIRLDTPIESNLSPGGSRKQAALGKSYSPAPKPERKKKWLIGASVAIGVLLLGLLLWSSNVFKWKTNYGILVVEVNEPNAELYVDGERMTVTWGDGGKKALITVKPGTHKVEVKKSGFSVQGKELTLNEGGREVFSATLLPLPHPSGPVDEEWLRKVATLPAEQQVTAVAAKLKELNPGFDGNLRNVIDKGAVVELAFPTDAVVDISPLRALPKLQRLDLNTPSRKGKLADLTPLQRISLTHLNLSGCNEVANLKPLQGMKLTDLRLRDCVQVRDLTPLKEMPLIHLDFGGCVQVRDLTPLKGMPLTFLDVWGCQAQDLTPLQEIKLEHLGLGNCVQVRDLTPLRSMPLTFLDLWCCRQVQDLGPLREMKLTFLLLNGCEQVHDLTPLQEMPLSKLGLFGCGQLRDLTPLQTMKKLANVDLGCCSALRDLTLLQEMPLTVLNLLGNCEVRDLTPLSGKKLTCLVLSECAQVQDLTPLREAPLEEFYFTPKNITKGIEGIRRMQSLKKIGVQAWQPFPAEEFWKRYDAGEFK
jgi:Leucine-rich repeat (LRR) protein